MTSFPLSYLRVSAMCHTDRAHRSFPNGKKVLKSTGEEKKKGAIVLKREKFDNILSDGRK